jgi:outer membrane protein
MGVVLPVASLCRRGISALLALALAVSPLATPGAVAETLREALAHAYRANPRLDAERARLRATDEDVPRAKAGFRPQINGSVDTSKQRFETDPKNFNNGDTRPWGYSVTLSQSVFSGFTTTNAVNEAEADVRAGREQLRTVEQQVLVEAVTAYADVVRDTRVVKLREANVAALSRLVEATEARRAVREVTRTDVAQAQARRARSVSQLDGARSSLKASQAAFEKVVGRPPQALSPPTPPGRHLPRTLDEALGIAEKESPVVVGALYREQAARFTVGRIRGELLPEVKLKASYGKRFDPTRTIDEQEQASVAGRVSVPFYDGGETSARVRQAKHTHVSRLQEVEQARTEAQAGTTQAWARFAAARAQIKSDTAQVEANRIAVEGVREEERAGQRSLLDVLNAEQELLDAEVALANSRREMIVASYTLLSQIGRMSAVELDLVEGAYDPVAHYEEVRSKWFGIDITRPDGRREQIDVSVQSDPAWLLDE